MEYNIDEIVNDIDFDGNMHKKINNLYLTENQINILDRYDIDYRKCTSMNELLYYIDECLELEESEELEKISLEIAETNYYMNTNK